MNRSPLRMLFALALPLSAGACFEDVPDAPIDETGTGDGDGDPSTGDGDGDPSTGDGDGDGDPSTGDGDGDGDPADPGPQIVSSTPAAGDQDAGLEPFFLLYFDRVIDDGDATGKVYVTQAGGAETPVGIQPCPDFDPTCIAGIFPMALLAEDGLPANTAHQIIVKAGFKDTEGNVTAADQLVEFKTFEYEANFFDDSAALPEEVGGLAYHPVSQALFVVGVHSNDFYGPRVRKIPIPNGSPQPATTVAEVMPGGGGPWTYGLDLYGNQLLVSMSYAGQVQAFTNLAANDLTPSVNFSATTLPEPHADVEEVWSVARSEDGRTFFAWGDFHGGANGSGIVQVTPDNVWSMFNEGVNLWNPSDDGVMITIGSVGGTEFLFASAEEALYKFRVADGTLVASYEVPQAYARDLEIDPMGRLWYGTNNGLYVYNVTSNDEVVELAERGGVRCSRLAIRPAPDAVHAYCVGYRDEALISHLPISL